MTILNNNNRPYFLTFGLEPEFVRPHYSNVDIHNHVDGVFAKSDGSLRDGGELELPIYADSNRAWEHIEKVFNVATNQIIAFQIRTNVLFMFILECDQ